MSSHKPKTCKQCSIDLPDNHNSIYCTPECKKIARRAQGRARYARNREDILKKAKKYREEHKEKCKEAQRRWRDKNKESISRYNRQWRQANPLRTKHHRDKWAAENADRMKAYKRKYANKNSDTIALRRHEQYINHRDEFAEARRRWKANNPDKVAAYVAKRAQIELEGDATDAKIREKWEASTKKCIICGEKIDMNLPPSHVKARTLEHLTPLVRGGRHDLDNIDFAHRGCNSRKGTKTLEEYRDWLARTRQAS